MWRIEYLSPTLIRCGLSDTVVRFVSLCVCRMMGARLFTYIAFVHMDWMMRVDGLKLCDFGISRIVEETGSKVREILGTPDYVAPEVCVLIRCMPLNRHINFQLDSFQYMQTIDLAAHLIYGIDIVRFFMVV